MNRMTVRWSGEPIGKMRCQYTGKTVTVYSLRKEEQMYIFHPKTEYEKVPSDVAARWLAGGGR